MNKKKIIFILLELLTLFVLLGIDQITKYFVILNLKNNSPLVLIDNILEFYYLENTGAAFGMMQNQKFFFIFIALLFAFVILYVMIKTPITKRYYTFHFALVFIMAGALGNMIDRIKYDYVIDFIYFKIIEFPIFNFADICVTCATIVLIILLLFVYKEKDLDFLSFKQKKYRELK